MTTGAGVREWDAWCHGWPAVFGLGTASRGAVMLHVLMAHLLDYKFHPRDPNTHGRVTSATLTARQRTNLHVAVVGQEDGRYIVFIKHITTTP